jgi:hypothetical protein
MPAACKSFVGHSQRLSPDLLCFWMLAGDMTPRQDPCQESSSVPAKGGTAVKGELLRLKNEHSAAVVKVNGSRHGAPG